MKKTALLATLIGMVMLAPLITALVVAGVVAPDVVAAIECGGNSPVVSTGDWRPPFQQRYTPTSTFGRRFHPVLQQWRLHTGQDLASLPGPGPVVAAAAGTVTATSIDTSYGNIVTVDHVGGITTRYAHLASVNPTIQPGVTVRIGQQLGVEGSTGTSTGNHLHFQVEQDGRPIDPVPFMRDRGAPLDGTAVAASTPQPTAASLGLDHVGLDGDTAEGGVGFDLPKPGTPRQDSLHNPALPIPAEIKKLYAAAADTYKLPWTLLAGIGMAETGHGRNNHTSSAGAQGLMQFMPATFTSMGVDGNSDGRADIRNDADSVYSAANYLTRSGVSQGAAGVRKAIFAYNHTTWYVNDVLYYANRYGGGTVLGDPNDCGAHGGVLNAGTGNPNLPPLTSDRVATVLGWAQKHDGDSYVFGASGPRAYDCSSFTQAAYTQTGIRMPRTAAAQRSWLAAGNGIRIRPGQEKPGDLIFWDSYLGPNQIGHVMIVWNPATKTTIEAHSTRAGIGHFSYTAGPKHHMLEIWRIGNLSDDPTRPAQR